MHKMSSSSTGRWNLPITRHAAIILPPPEYECPYKGALHITRAPTTTDVRIACPGYKGANEPLGCAVRTVDHAHCFVVLLEDKAIKARGYEPEDIYRHELAHCLGWKHDDSQSASQCK